MLLGRRLGFKQRWRGGGRWRGGIASFASFSSSPPHSSSDLLRLPTSPVPQPVLERARELSKEDVNEASRMAALAIFAAAQRPRLASSLAIELSSDEYDVLTRADALALGALGQKSPSKALSWLGQRMEGTVGYLACCRTLQGFVHRGGRWKDAAPFAIAGLWSELRNDAISQSSLELGVWGVKRVVEECKGVNWDVVCEELGCEGSVSRELKVLGGGKVEEGLHSAVQRVWSVEANDRELDEAVGVVEDEVLAREAADRGLVDLATLLVPRVLGNDDDSGVHPRVVGDVIQALCVSAGGALEAEKIVWGLFRQGRRELGVAGADTLVGELVHRGQIKPLLRVLQQLHQLGGALSAQGVVPLIRLRATARQMIQDRDARNRDTPSLAIHVTGYSELDRPRTPEATLLLTTALSKLQFPSEGAITSLLHPLGPKVVDALKEVHRKRSISQSQRDSDNISFPQLPHSSSTTTPTPPSTSLTTSHHSISTQSTSSPLQAAAERGLRRRERLERGILMREQAVKRAGATGAVVGVPATTPVMRAAVRIFRDIMRVQEAEEDHVRLGFGRTFASGDDEEGVEDLIDHTRQELSLRYSLGLSAAELDKMEWERVREKWRKRIASQARGVEALLDEEVEAGGGGGEGGGGVGGEDGVEDAVSSPFTPVPDPLEGPPTGLLLPGVPRDVGKVEKAAIRVLQDGTVKNWDGLLKVGLELVEWSVEGDGGVGIWGWSEAGDVRKALELGGDAFRVSDGAAVEALLRACAREKDPRLGEKILNRASEDGVDVSPSMLLSVASANAGAGIPDRAASFFTRALSSSHPQSLSHSEINTAINTIASSLIQSRRPVDALLFLQTASLLAPRGVIGACDLYGKVGVFDWRGLEPAIVETMTQLTLLHCDTLRQHSPSTPLPSYLRIYTPPSSLPTLHALLTSHSISLPKHPPQSPHPLFPHRFYIHVNPDAWMDWLTRPHFEDPTPNPTLAAISSIPPPTTPHAPYLRTELLSAALSDAVSRPEHQDRPPGFVRNAALDPGVLELRGLPIFSPRAAEIDKDPFLIDDSSAEGVMDESGGSVEEEEEEEVDEEFAAWHARWERARLRARRNVRKEDERV